MVVYNFGGPCGFCTFDTITSLLLGVLRFLHDNIFHDWSLSIVFLVVIVRTLLHPLTRWTQVRMAVFGKQMSGIGPKQKLIQERYKDDPAKLQQETAKLWREEGISPAGFLGCLPAFAQTPVWIALSAVLFFAVELRHQHAFYGVFQSVQKPEWITWWFLGDLAEPDAIIHFGRAITTLPILGPITSINLLPVLLGIVFFIQQKYLQPPTATQMTPEQEMQAKMMKWMTVFMFPVMMYNAPAGLALYFTVNSTLAIIESKWIRAHMDRHGMLDMDKIRAAREARRAAKGSAPKGGFMTTLQQYAEKKQQEAQRSFGQDKHRKK
jgi:YidC/Oxa1 family membrane protein insertase